MRRRTLLNELANLFYPNVCVVCGNELLEKEVCVCLKCLSGLPKTYDYLQKENALEKLMAARIPFERIAS